MKIRMTVDMPEGATRNGEPWPAKGETAVLPTAEAAHLVASGVAEEVADQDAEPSEPEAAETRRTRRKATAIEEE